MIAGHNQMMKRDPSTTKDQTSLTLETWVSISTQQQDCTKDFSYNTRLFYIRKIFYAKTKHFWILILFCGRKCSIIFHLNCFGALILCMVQNDFELSTAFEFFLFIVVCALCMNSFTLAHCIKVQLNVSIELEQFWKLYPDHIWSLPWYFPTITHRNSTTLCHHQTLINKMKK